MSGQQREYALDIAKIVAIVGMIATGVYWAGKLDQKVSDIKDDVVQIKQVVFQPKTVQATHSITRNP
jgi:type IV secretory pathway VirB2 component (pilin)